MMNALMHDRPVFNIGPVGTGKTETVKDLGKKLGISTIVFNCSDELEFAEIKPYIGSVNKDKYWVCFDESNRLNNRTQL